MKRSTKYMEGMIKWQATYMWKKYPQFSRRTILKWIISWHHKNNGYIGKASNFGEPKPVSPLLPK